MKARWMGWAICLLLVAGTALPGMAQEDEEEKNWANKTELGLTLTSGNSEVTNLSFGNEYRRYWDKAEFNFDIKVINNESKVQFYTGDPANPEFVEATQTNAETYFVGLGYRRAITGRLYWFVNGHWFRNEPAALLDRYRGTAGIGYQFIEGNKHHLKGEIGAAYTDDTKAIPITLDPSGEISDDYTSAYAMLDYRFAFSETAELTSVANWFQDIDESDNWQANWITAVTASLTSKLALRVTYTLVYDNLPGFIDIPPAPGVTTGPISVQADKADNFLTASLVLNF